MSYDLGQGGASMAHNGLTAFQLTEEVAGTTSTWSSAA